MRRLKRIPIAVAVSVFSFCSAAWPQSPRAAAAPKVEEVIVAYKTHFDIGYTGLVADVLARYRGKMIDDALDVADRSLGLPPDQRFIWTVPGWPLTQILWPGQTAERRTRVLRAIRNGQIVWHGWPFTTETESNGLEDLVRGMRFSSDLARALGRPLPRDAKMTDVPEHSWIIPTIMHRAGIEFLHIGCNATSSEPELPPLFWWEGPDGSRLLTMYSGQYGSGIQPPAGWPHKTWLAMIMTGDNHGPPTPDQVRSLLDRAARELPGVKVRFGRLSDFADAILREKPELPVVRADMPDTWIHGVMSMPVETGLARNVRPRIAALEELGTLLGAWNVNAATASGIVRQAYENSLLYGEHTWGLNVPQFGFRYGDEWRRKYESGYYKRLEQSFDDHRAYIRRVDAAVTPALEERLGKLARGVRTQGRRVVVFNPLPWRRDSVVEVRLPGAAVRGLRDVETGEVLPAATENGRLIFVAKAVSAFGYRTYVPAAAPQERTDVAAAGESIENAWFRARLDKARGGISSLIAKRSGRELVDGSSSRALGQYLLERFDSEDVQRFLEAYVKTKGPWGPSDFGKLNLPPAKERPHEDASPNRFTLEVGRNEVAVTGILRAAPSSKVPYATSVKATLYRGQPYLDVEWSVFNKVADPWPEAGWLCFPLRIRQPAFRVGRIGSVIDPARDVVRGANHTVLHLETGVALRERGGAGIALCPLDSPLVSLERPGIWKYSRDFVPTKPEVFVNLFNNQWSTNFPQWIGGSWSSRVRIFLADTGDDTRDLIVPAWEARVPCLAAVADGAAGPLAPAQSGVELSRAGVLVSAFGANPDGEGTLLRLWDQSGRSGVCGVRLPASMQVHRAQPCDLRGRPAGAALAVRDGAFEIPVDAWAPASVLLK